MNQEFRSSFVCGDARKRLAALGLSTAKVVKTSQTGESKPVWDVSLKEQGVLPFSIITNGIVTHNSEDFGYFASTIETCATRPLSVEDVFGIVDRSTGEIIKQPRVRVYNESVGEQFFDSMASMLRNMPDKNYIDGQWYYVYENTKPNQKLTSGKYNKELFSEYNKFCVPAENGKPQALLLVDSYPYMFPDQLDEDDKGAGMAAVARMFSANIPKLAPKLKRKGVVVLGVNQLRLRPAVRNANPEYEPSGEAIKFCSGVRVKQTRRAIPHGTGSVEEEDSVMIDGGLDTYHYLVQKAAKNKTGGITGAEVWQRVWVADAEGRAHGIDPVWDTFQYLKLTGQLTGHMKKMTIKLPHLELTKISWWDFKCLILYQGADLKAVCAELGIKKNPKIRETCRNQLNNGTGYQMYIEHTRQTGSAEEAEEEE